MNNNNNNNNNDNNKLKYLIEQMPLRNNIVIDNYSGTMQLKFNRQKGYTSDSLPGSDDLIILENDNIMIYIFESQIKSVCLFNDDSIFITLKY